MAYKINRKLTSWLKSRINSRISNKSSAVICRGWFEPSVTSNLAVLMSFSSVTKFSIVSPLYVMSRFTFKHRWDLLEIYFQNKDNCSEIERKYCKIFKIWWLWSTYSARYTQVYCLSAWNWFHCWYVTTVCTPENFETLVEIVRQKTINSSLFSRIEHFKHQFTSNFAKISRSDVLQSLISSRIEIAQPSASFLLR